VHSWKWARIRDSGPIQVELGPKFRLVTECGAAAPKRPEGLQMLACPLSDIILRYPPMFLMSEVLLYTFKTKTAHVYNERGTLVRV